MAHRPKAADSNPSAAASRGARAHSGVEAVARRNTIANPMATITMPTIDRELRRVVDLDGWRNLPIIIGAKTSYEPRTISTADSRMC